jgi:hypothetical protein
MLKGLPELGVLLQMEKDLPRLVREIYGGGKPMFSALDEERWKQAEARLRAALSAFAEAAQSSYQGRLFAQDALLGLRIIDLTREAFDVVVMNPPFGMLTPDTKRMLGKVYPKSKNDLLAIFIERCLSMIRNHSRIGAITSRTCFFLPSYEKWRRDIVLGMSNVECFADLGLNVMDDALVEGSAFVLEKSA